MSDENDPTTAPESAPHLPSVTGRCPACGGAALFLAEGGHVTCGIAECPYPTGASRALRRQVPDVVDLGALIEAAVDRLGDLADRLEEAAHVRQFEKHFDGIREALARQDYHLARERMAGLGRMLPRADLEVKFDGAISLGDGTYLRTR